MNYPFFYALGGAEKQKVASMTGIVWPSQTKRLANAVMPVIYLNPKPIFAPPESVFALFSDVVSMADMVSWAKN